MAGGAIAGTAIGTAVPGLGNLIGLLVGAGVGTAGYLLGKKAGESGADLAQGKPHSQGGFINSGNFGVEHPVLAQRGEAILNPKQQRNFMALANNNFTTVDDSKISIGGKVSIKRNRSTYGLRKQNTPKMLGNAIGHFAKFQYLPITAPIYGIKKIADSIKPKPVGGREYIYTPRNSETSNINGSQVTVKDFNVNISGTIRLDGGNTSKNIDVRQLLNDYSFVSSLKDIIKESINTDMNNGRFLNDFAVRRGQTSSSSIVGKN